LLKKNSYFIVGLIAFLFFLLLHFSFKNISLKINDSLNYFSYYLFRERLPEDIIVVGIDDYSLKNIPFRWPWKRSLYSKFLNILNEEKVNSVFFDLTFLGSSEGEEDRAFSEAIKIFPGNILLAYFIDKEGNPIYPFGDFKKDTKIGFINTPQDEDGLIRRLRGNIKEEISFSVEAASLYLRKDVEILPNSLKIGRRIIPLDRIKSFNLNYLFKSKDLRYISFFDVLEKKFPKGQLKDKFIFVGPVAKIIHDLHPTPFGELPGLYIHLNGFLDIVKDRLVRNINVEFLICFFIIFFISAVLKRVSFLKGIFLSLGILLFLFWIDIFLYLQGFRYNFGDVFIFSILFLFLGNLYRYFYLLGLLLKIKNRAIKDPITDLYTQRYFYYLLGLNLSKFYLSNLYLVCILVDGLKEIMKDLDFLNYKEILKEISLFLKRQRIKGAVFSEDSITGFFYFKGNIKDTLLNWKFHIEEIISQRNLNLKIRMGYQRAYRGIQAKEFFLNIFQKLRSTSQELVEYSQIVKAPKFGEIPKDILEFLGKDIEEKNLELVNLLEKLKEEEKRREKAYFDLVTSLVIAIEERDPYTQGHSERVSNNCLLFAKRLKFDSEEKEKLRKAALLHDIGKIGIPDEILHKKEKLTDEEFDFIKKHISLGVKILEPITELKDLIPYILYHHERYDGTGYPFGLSRDMIPLSAQIIGICDTFDALITGRDYKKGLSVQESIQELEKSKLKQFDPQIVETFIDLILKKGP